MPRILPFRPLRPAPEEPLPDCLSGGACRLLREENASLYVERMIREGHVQTGLIACVDVSGYREGTIKRHESIRPAKVDIQVGFLERDGANLEPVLLTYEACAGKIPVIDAYTKDHSPLYDFAGEDDTIHTLWRISEPEAIAEIERFFESVGAFYICDGHHRIAASSAYAERAKTPESRSVLASIFPSDEMHILDFNRAVADLNGLANEAFFEKLRNASFEIERLPEMPREAAPHGEYAMVLDDEWYRLRYTGERDESSPVNALDASLLQTRVLGPILGVHDPSNDERIAFIPGTNGMTGLQAATHRGMKIGFAVAPVTMEEVFAVADAGLAMPPKSTRFEPKPLRNLLIHTIR